MVTKIDGESIPPPIPSERRAQAPAQEAVTIEHNQQVAQSTPTYDFQFRVDPETKEVIAMILDPATRAVIREIPAEEMKTAARVIRNLIGPLVEKLA